MGEHAYAYRGHSNYGNYGSSGDGYQVFPTVIYDSDGTKRTVLGRSPYDSEYYAVETEVTEYILSPLVTDYRYGSLQKVNPVRDYGSYGSYENYRRPTIPPYNARHPQDLNQFLTDVPVEASWPPHRYSPSNGGAVPVNYSIGVTPGYGGTDRYKTNISSGYDGYSSDEDDYDREEEAYYKPGHTVRRPEVNPKYNNGHGGGGTTGGWVAPVSTNSPQHANSKLSFPTNSIEEAIDFLKGGLKNTSNTSEVGNPYGYNNSNSKLNSTGSEAVRPYGYNSSNLKTDSLESLKPYSAKSRQTEEPKQVESYAYNCPQLKTASLRNETIKPNGAKSNQAPVMDCYEAARRYNGKVVRT